MYGSAVGYTAMTDEKPDVVERSRKLDEQIASTDVTGWLVRTSRRSQLLIQVLGVLVAIVFLLVIAVGIIGVQAIQLARQANSLERQAYTTCVAGNDSRAGQLELWTYVLMLVPSGGTPLEVQRLAEFRAFIGRLFAPRKCTP